MWAFYLLGVGLDPPFCLCSLWNGKRLALNFPSIASSKISFKTGVQREVWNWIKFWFLANVTQWKFHFQTYLHFLGLELSNKLLKENIKIVTNINLKSGLIASITLWYIFAQPFSLCLKNNVNLSQWNLKSLKISQATLFMWLRICWPQQTSVRLVVWGN